MAKTERMPFGGGYNYDRLATRTVSFLRSVAGSCWPAKRKTLDEVVAIGIKLCAAKQLLGRGEFVEWLGVVFRSRMRTPRNYMAVSKWLGKESAIIAQLDIAPTACYLLTGRSVPEATQREALARAMAGEKIPVVVAREIIATGRRHGPANGTPGSDRTLWLLLVKILDERQNQFRQLGLLAQHLRNYADSIDIARKNGKPVAKTNRALGQGSLRVVGG